MFGILIGIWVANILPHWEEVCRLLPRCGAPLKRPVIRSFRDRAAEKVWKRAHVRSLGPELQRAAQKKLCLLNAASELNSLRVHPGIVWRSWWETELASTRFASMTYRICFVWTEAGPTEVEITDHH